MHKALWSCVFACTLLAACAGMHPRVARESRQQGCESGNACVVNVSVACEHFYGCELSVDYDLVVVNGRGKSTEITWRLTGESGARFAGNGIVFGSGEFKCAERAEAREFACTDMYSDFGVFKYRVNVTVPKSLFGPRGVPSLDPWIVNR